MKRKVLLALSMIAVMTCLLVLSVGAENPVYTYDNDRTTTLDNGTTVDLYDENGNALSYYYDSNGALVKALTTDIFKWNSSGWLEMKNTSVCPASNVVVANLQDPTMDETASGNYGINVSFRHSTSLEYVYFSNMIKKFNGMYYFSNCDKMKVFEITEDSALESFGSYSFYDCAVLGSLHIPKGVIALPDSNDGSIGFASKCPLLQKVTFSPSSQLETISQAAFYGSDVREIIIPDSVTEIKNNAFYNSGLVNSPFTENSKCEIFGQYCFRNCDNLKNFIVPAKAKIIQNSYYDYSPLAECDNIEYVRFGKGAIITEIPSHFFSRANIARIEIPETVTTIGRRAFYMNKTLTEIKLPNALKTIGERAFESCSSLKIINMGASFESFFNTTTDHGSFTYGAPVSTFYIPASFYEEAPETAYRVSYMFQCNGNSNTIIFYAGTKAQLDTSIANFKSSTTNATDNNGALLSAEHVSYSEYILAPENFEKGRYIVYDYNPCVAFYNGEHTENDNPCVIYCDRCDEFDGQMKENPQHDFEISIVYGDFTLAGVKYEACKNEGCVCKTTPEETAVPAVITGFSGYSIKLGGNGITFGFNMNIDALNEYELYSEKVEIGTVVAVKSYLNGQNPIGADGNPVALEKGNIIKAQATDKGNIYSRVDFVLKGDMWDSSIVINEETVALKNLEFVMCPYVICDGVVSYISTQGSVENAGDIVATYSAIQNNNDIPVEE